MDIHSGDAYFDEDGLVTRIRNVESFLDLLPGVEQMPRTIRSAVSEIVCTELRIRTNRAAENNYFHGDGEPVSIVIPTFNSYEFIEQTLESAFAQIGRNVHAIVVDDSSTDRTEELVLMYMRRNSDSSPITFLRVPHTGNPGITRNLALFNLLPMGTRYVGFIDSDDLYADQTAIDKLASALDTDPEAFAAVGDYDFICTMGKVIHGPAGIRRSRSQTWQWRADKVLSWKNLATGRIGVFHLQCLMVRIGVPFIPYRYVGEDAAYYEQLFRLSATYCNQSLNGVIQVPALVAHYRKHAQSLTSGVQRERPKLSQREILPEHDPSIPLFYELAQVPEDARGRAVVSEWYLRRGLRDLVRAFRGDGSKIGGALMQIVKDRRIRRRDYLVVPVTIVYFWIASLEWPSSRLKRQR